MDAGTDTITLTEFLTARLDDDEALARGAGADAWRAAGTWWLEGVEHHVVAGQPDREVAFTHDGEDVHIARHDPARVLREVEAKRAIVELHYSWNLQVAQAAADPAFGPILEAQAGAAKAILCRLAAVYADHPDYRDEWRP